MRKPRIFFYTQYFDGTGYYRMHTPAMMIQKLGLAEVVTNPFNAYKPPKETWTDLNIGVDGLPKASKFLFKALGDASKPNVDAIIIQRMDTFGMLATAMALRATYNIPVLQENDDYVFDVPNTNPGSLEYHERIQERQGDPNDPITVARRSLGVFDGYITTTPFLKEFFSNYAPTYVCPNSVDVDARVVKPREPHKDIRIMFSSSAGHFDALEMIKEPITYILERYPNTTFYCYKFMRNLWKGTKLEKRVKLMTWKDPDQYWQHINSYAPDICLAPLRDRLYNRGKSNLRLLEYWTSGPNAVIASPVGHYKETIVDGKNGLFAKHPDDWINKIDYLIKHPEVRQRIARGGYQTVKRDFNLKKNARLWVDAVKDAIANYTPDRLPPEQYLSPEDRATIAASKPRSGGEGVA